MACSENPSRCGQKWAISSRRQLVTWDSDMSADLLIAGRAIAFVASCSVLSVPVAHARDNLPPVTGVQAQPSSLMAADKCCHSGEAQLVLKVLSPTSNDFGYGTVLARKWNDLVEQQQAEIRKKWRIPWVPLLNRANPLVPFQPRPRECDVANIPATYYNRACRTSLSVSADPQSKLLKVFWRVYKNRLLRAPNSAFCGTFDVEVAMVFEVTTQVTLQSSEVRSFNFATSHRCDGLGLERLTLNNEVFVDAGTAAGLADSINDRTRRMAGVNGIRVITPGVRPEDKELLVFEITPAEVAVPIGGAH